MTNVLPVCNPQCPYKIPLSSYVYVAARGFESILRRWIQPHLIPLPAYALQLYRATWSELHQIRTAVSIPCDLYLSEKPIDAKTVQQQPRNLQLWETPAVETNGQLLDAQMLTWLCKMSANPTVGNVVAAPVSDLPIGFSERRTRLYVPLTESFVSMQNYYQCQITSHILAYLASAAPGGPHLWLYVAKQLTDPPLYEYFGF